MTDSDDSLLENLRRAAEPPAAPAWRPGVTYSGRTPSEIVTPPMEDASNMTDDERDAAVRAMGFPLPEGFTLELVEAQYVYHENFWTRENQGDDATTKPSSSWRYRFRVVPKSARSDIDISVLTEEAKKFAYVPREALGHPASMVVSLADFQVGKTDVLGGTVELLERSEQALSQVREAALERQPHEIILVDPGDSTEGFESAPNAAQKNDLDLTEQVRVWRRILWRWVAELSSFAPSMKVISVPSNHCRVRRGKNAQGGILDDWGIEVLAQVSDIAAVNPAAFGHVSFHVPQEHQEHVLIPLIGGKVLGVAHGHQKNNVDQIPAWIKSTSRNGVGQADMILIGHFHHFEARALGARQWLFVSPTMDAGSSWFTPSSGEESDPGVLHFFVDEDGWYGLDIAWTA